MMRAGERAATMVGGSRRPLLTVAFLAGLGVGVAPGHAQPAPAGRMARDPVDLNGVWWPRQPEGFEFKPNPVLTPAAQVVWDKVRGQMAVGKVDEDSTAACIPAGTPRLMTRVYPIQWLRYDRGYALVHEYEHEVRWFYLDGRKAPTGEDLIPTFNGYSIGHWEGDELVVETTGFKPRSESGHQVWIQLGVRVSPQLKLVERYKLIDGGKTLRDEITMIDPTTFAKPWVTVKQFELKPKVDIMEYTCLADENPITTKADGTTVFKDLADKPAAAAGKQ